MNSVLSSELLHWFGWLDIPTSSVTTITSSAEITWKITIFRYPIMYDFRSEVLCTSLSLKIQYRLSDNAAWNCRTPSLGVRVKHFHGSAFFSATTWSQLANLNVLNCWHLMPVTLQWIWMKAIGPPYLDRWIVITLWILQYSRRHDLRLSGSVGCWVTKIIKKK